MTEQHGSEVAAIVLEGILGEQTVLEQVDEFDLFRNSSHAFLRSRDQLPRSRLRLGRRLFWSQM